MIRSGKCSDISDHSSLNRVLELNAWYSVVSEFSVVFLVVNGWSVVFDDFGYVSGKLSLFPVPGCIMERGWLQTRGNRHISRGLKGISYCYFHYRLKKHAWAGTVSTWEIHMWGYTLGTLCCTLASAGVDLHQIQNKVNKHPFVLLWLAVCSENFLLSAVRNIFEAEHYWERCA